MLLYSYGCWGCYIEEGCGCEFGDIESYLFNTTNKIYKFDCCESSFKTMNESYESFSEEYLRDTSLLENTFKYDYLESHSDFYRLEIFTKDKNRSIEISSFLFNEDYKHKQHNLSRKPKLLIDSLNSVLKNNQTIKWQKLER